MLAISTKQMPHSTIIRFSQKASASCASFDLAFNIGNLFNDQAHQQGLTTPEMTTRLIGNENTAPALCSRFETSLLLALDFDRGNLGC